MEQFESVGWEVFAAMRCDLMKRSDPAYTIFNRMSESLMAIGEAEQFDLMMQNYVPEE